ncbi:MAG: phosphoribosylformylglycinamidine synthase subunit PurS [Chloroflexia bacterium]|jgi:phosphoribosylformylglycinamidine synthase|nr:phosphoribosylformylglycinamidine synthase subunit PurS [Chloroflexia bacterium]
MQKWLANVYVTLKPVVNDPPGLSIRAALHNLGYEQVQTVRSGKYIRLHMEAADEPSAREAVDAMCQRLLANPVIEDYHFTLEEE